MSAISTKATVQDAVVDEATRPLKILIAGGGTGGHLYPALAIAEEIQRRQPDAEITFVGTRRGLEARVVPAQGYPLKHLWVQGFRRGLRFSNVLFPFRLIVSLVQSLFMLLKLRPDAVVGTGGYVSGPVVFMAALVGIPTVIQEQNSYPGVSTRLLRRFVDEVHLSFEESRQFFRNQSKLRVSGNPVRRQLGHVSKEEARKNLRLHPGEKTLLIFGGSQGAHRINLTVAEALSELMTQELQILWSCGDLDFDLLQEKCKPYGDRIRLVKFIDDMASAYAAADLAVCRAGALTIAELTLCGLPAILIPYPFAAAGHQEHNAKILAQQGAAEMILDRELTPPLLAERINALLADPTRRQAMSEKMRALAHPEAAEKIVDAILKRTQKE